MARRSRAYYNELIEKIFEMQERIPRIGKYRIREYKATIFELQREARSIDRKIQLDSFDCNHNAQMKYNEFIQPEKETA